MGLDTSHGAWHGAYSAFMTWRKKLAEVAGLPPLELMEGFFIPEEAVAGNPFSLAIHLLEASGTGAFQLVDLQSRLPIKWDCLRPDPLRELLFHSDCDGELDTGLCGPIADRLEQLLPLLPDEDAGGHIGNWREKTQRFIDGLRLAAAANEPVRFH